MSAAHRPADLALDIGASVTKLAAGCAGAVPTFDRMATAAGDRNGFLTEVLARASSLAGGPIERICCTVPDAWLEGSVAGARACEAMRHVTEDELGWMTVSWVGQLGAIAAFAAQSGPLANAAQPEKAAAAGQPSHAAQSRLLVCDIGACGVRIALCEIADRVVRPLAVRTAADGGWRDFDAAVQAALAADDDPQLHQWFVAARAQEQRAVQVLGDAADDPDFRGTRVYRITGRNRHHDLDAGQLMDCFAATEQRLRAGISAVLGDVTPTAAVVTGGLAWFPLVAQVVTDAAMITPEILGPDAAARGALLISLGDLQLARPSLPTVRLPMHQVRNGLLEDVRLPLPWTSSFAPMGDDPLILEGPDLVLEVDGQLRAIHLPHVVPGRYRIGIRPARSGPGLLVLRPDGPAGDQAVHVDSLDDLELA